MGVRYTPGTPVGRVHRTDVGMAAKLRALNVGISRRTEPVVTRIPSLKVKNENLSFNVATNCLCPVVNTSSKNGFAKDPMGCTLNGGDRRMSCSSNDKFAVNTRTSVELCGGLCLVTNMDCLRCDCGGRFRSGLAHIVPRADGITLIKGARGVCSRRCAVGAVRVPMLTSCQLPVGGVDRIRLGLNPIIGCKLSTAVGLSKGASDRAVRGCGVSNRRIAGRECSNCGCSVRCANGKRLSLCKGGISFCRACSRNGGTSVGGSGSFRTSPCGHLRFKTHVNIACRCSKVDLNVRCGLVLAGLTGGGF